MGLWYLASLLFAIFSSLYFIYGKDRLLPTTNYHMEIAGLFEACRGAALTEAKLHEDLGKYVTTVKNCNVADLPSAASMNLNAPGIKVVIEPRAVTEAGKTGRNVTTYIPLDQSVLSIPYNDASRQIREYYSSTTNTGLVIQNLDPVTHLPVNHISYVLDSSGVVHTTVYTPLVVAPGSTASVTLVDP